MNIIFIIFIIVITLLTILVGAVAWNLSDWEKIKQTRKEN